MVFGWGFAARARRAGWVVCCAVLVWLSGWRGTVAAEPLLPLVTLRAGLYQITAELAGTQRAREQGLMFRTVLPPKHGMLFRFPFPDRHCMWMKNTPLPLAVAFLDDAGRIVNIAEMAPHTLTPHCAAQPVRWALEMPGGWFRERGIVVGMRIHGLDAIDK